MVSPKKNAGQFKKGRRPYYRKGETMERWTDSDINKVPTVRLTRELHDQVVAAPKSSPVNAMKSHRLLRPSPTVKDEELR